MKKMIIVSTLLISCTLPQITNTNSLNAEASVYKMSEKTLKISNLVDEEIITNLNEHNYNYYGITTNTTKKDLVNKWGLPKKIIKDQQHKRLDEKFIYGKNSNVIVTIRSHSDVKNSGKVLALKIIDKNSNIKFKDIYPSYKENFHKIKDKNKLYLTNDLISIKFEKKYKTYYATELNYKSGTTILE
ncbi:hypothetical protein [Macrococcus capreoli]|uniref:hypothetical protein n=1 Tax=Macrococcus capreoli TaxID=2982690 RepID=UPI003EE68499